MASRREEPPAQQRLGDFEILREIGRGGMGVVYEARQVSLNRKVALKVLAPGLGLTRLAVERFHREAQAAAKLHHTNIVPVHATGEHDGTHFYAMELIEGPSLDQVLNQLKQEPQPGQAPKAATSTRPDLLETALHIPGSSSSGPAAELSTSSLSSGGSYFDTVARMVADVADALEYAHRNGVIHRDVKPSNLLLSPDGRLSINDFGLARVLEQPGMTMTGEFVGTPAYMSPEQITAGRTPLDHRTDVYSLGATLYQMLTLQPPFAAERRDQMLAQVLHKEPTPPRRVNKKAPIDLETICLKALEKDPDRRYQTAGQLAKDLRHYVNRFAITARRTGPVGQLQKWVRRNPGLAAGLGCTVLATAAAVLIAYRGYAVEQRRLAEKLRIEQQLHDERRETAVENAILEAMSGDFDAAIRAIGEAESLQAEPGLLNLLRGFIEQQRGRVKEALGYVEQAARQNPNSVAVKAQLVGLYWENSQWQQANQMVVQLEQMVPKAPEDHIFLGLRQTSGEPLRALETLSNAPARFRQSAVGREMRATAHLQLAYFTGRIEDVERSIVEINKLDGSADNLRYLCNRFYVFLNASDAYDTGDPRRDSALQQARYDFEALARHLDRPEAVLARCYYHYSQRDDEGLLEEVRHALSKGHVHPDATGLAICVHYANKKFEQALRLASDESVAEPWELIYWGIALVAIPHRTQEAERAFRAAIRNCDGGGNLPVVNAYLQLLGPEFRTEARKAALEIRERSSHLIPNQRNRWCHELLAFQAGVLSLDELLEKAGDNRVSQCEGLFYAGLQRLAEGRRSDAAACFTRAVAKKTYPLPEYQWSRAFLALIDDPEWLPWIPVEK
jgi:serine/threonine protein kinase